MHSAIAGAAAAATRATVLQLTGSFVGTTSAMMEMPLAVLPENLLDAVTSHWKAAEQCEQQAHLEERGIFS